PPSAVATIARGRGLHQRSDASGRPPGPRSSRRVSLLWTDRYKRGRRGREEPDERADAVMTPGAGGADRNWFAVLEHHATRTPGAVLATCDGEPVTYGEMRARAIALAGGLHAHGVGAGSVVGLLSYNCTEFL